MRVPVRQAKRSPLFAVLVMSGVLLVLTGCREGRGEVSGDVRTSTTVALADASTITLTGHVTRSFGNHVTQLGTAPSEPVIVVFPQPTAFPDGARVEVSGRIRTFSKADIEAELQIELGPEVDGLAGAKCLIAVSVRSL